MLMFIMNLHNRDKRYTISQNHLTTELLGTEHLPGIVLTKLESKYTHPDQILIVLQVLA